jgi:hypothetical protein
MNNKTLEARYVVSIMIERRVLTFVPTVNLPPKESDDVEWVKEYASQQFPCPWAAPAAVEYV